mmetsp:Transcript_26531/g.25388  ORF Transcript_26531/g.25388 Transcript_26531/m.25388 type:complete len:160 (-) Transcript_26531:56-535(-)
MTELNSSSSKHNLPADGGSCMCCWDDLEASTYVEYLSSSESEWLPSGYCNVCIEMIQKTQWSTYTTALEKTTCKAEQRRLLAKGPPINVSDTKALPCPDGGEVHTLWYMSDGLERSAKLEGSLTGEDRQKYWDEQASFYIAEEVDDEGDEKKDEISAEK